MRASQPLSRSRGLPHALLMMYRVDLRRGCMNMGAQLSRCRAPPRLNLRPVMLLEPRQLELGRRGVLHRSLKLCYQLRLWGVQYIMMVPAICSSWRLLLFRSRAPLAIAASTSGVAARPALEYTYSVTTKLERAIPLQPIAENITTHPRVVKQSHGVRDAEVRIIMWLAMRPSGNSRMCAPAACLTTPESWLHPPPHPRQ